MEREVKFGRTTKTKLPDRVPWLEEDSEFLVSMARSIKSLLAELRAFSSSPFTCVSPMPITCVEAYMESFRNLLHKRNGNRSEWEYPFAVAGINISFMLVQMLDLQSGTPSTLAGIRFLELLSEDDMAFDNIFCIAFEMLDAQWLAKRASYMEFNEVLKATRVQLERELALEDTSSVKDLPAYNLLRR